MPAARRVCPRRRGPDAATHGPGAERAGVSDDHIEKVLEITRVYNVTHGEPIAFGWDALARLGIRDIDNPEWDEAPQAEDGSPWAVMRAGIRGAV
ncbi:hypothetical protein DL771_006114 [Monosporascus sp. 5C6A]|nr:hypothetical protein DL771_006114 [Monosporascus sp. 5C6A]